MDFIVFVYCIEKNVGERKLRRSMLPVLLIKRFIFIKYMVYESEKV